MEVANEIQCVHTVRITNKFSISFFIIYRTKCSFLCYDYTSLKWKWWVILVWAVVSRNANDIEKHNHRMILLTCAVVGDTSEIVGALYVHSA